MNATVEDLSPTIIPKSDQLNADQLVAGEMDITVTEVSIGSGQDQPVTVNYANDAGRPFKPCKTMRRVLIKAWGSNGLNWIGRSMRLYHDPRVKWAGDEVGGVRISHMTDIPEEIRVSLSHSKGKKALHVIKPMKAADVVPDDGIRHIVAATTEAECKKALEVAWKAAKAAGADKAHGDRLKAAYEKRKAELQQPVTSPASDAKTVEQWCDDIEAAADRDMAKVLLDAALSAMPDEHHEHLAATFERAWT